MSSGGRGEVGSIHTVSVTFASVQLSDSMFPSDVTDVLMSLPGEKALCLHMLCVSLCRLWSELKCSEDVGRAYFSSETKAEKIHYL